MTTIHKSPCCDADIHIDHIASNIYKFKGFSGSAFKYGEQLESILSDEVPRLFCSECLSEIDPEDIK